MKTLFTCHTFLLLFLFSISVMGQDVLSEKDSISSTDLASEISDDSIQPSTDKNKEAIYSGRSSYTGNDIRTGQETKKESGLSNNVVIKSETNKSLVKAADKLTIGYTYNRYGEIAYPKGYGVQVVAFCNFKNLQRYLRLFSEKELYIQVIEYTSQSVPLYRVIIGANEDKELIEKEITLFNNAGVSAVLRKHKNAEFEVYNYTGNKH